MTRNKKYLFNILTSDDVYHFCLIMSNSIQCVHQQNLCNFLDIFNFYLYLNSAYLRNLQINDCWLRLPKYITYLVCRVTKCRHWKWNRRAGFKSLSSVFISNKSFLPFAVSLQIVDDHGFPQVPLVCSAEEI